MDALLLPFDRPLRTELQTALTDTPVVALLGPRQCGKTTLVRTFAPGRAYVSLDEEALHKTARSDPTGFIASLPDPTTVDEVQRAPDLLQAIKLAVDRDRRIVRHNPTAVALLGRADGKPGGMSCGMSFLAVSRTFCSVCAGGSGSLGRPAPVTYQ